MNPQDRIMLEETKHILDETIEEDIHATIFEIKELEWKMKHAPNQVYGYQKMIRTRKTFIHYLRRIQELRSIKT